MTRKLAEIEFGIEDKGSRTVYFVRDNGVGFDMSHSEVIFQPFKRIHTDIRFKGSGIGLATVRRIIAKHGGSVWVESEPDRGTTFFFTLR
jgi:light-regulated signal transduction histidine kinase (bacteriophytochrome)